MSITNASQKQSPLLVILAFATVYIVWGSTYFFILQCVRHIPPFLVGFFRFVSAGILMLAWSLLKGEKVLDRTIIKHAIVSGVLLLFIGNGAVIWAEQVLPSSFAAVLVSAAPIWFVVLDKRNWKENLHSTSTIIGLIIGFLGVILLFSTEVKQALASSSNTGMMTGGLIVLIFGSISWAGGSLYSKYNSAGGGHSKTAWQMLAGGLAFLPAAFITQEWKAFNVTGVPVATWLSLIYLIIFGSLLAYTAYVWLLGARPATQVSTYAYVNPVVAVLLGVFLAGEKVGWIQIIGLVIVLASVLLINLAKYRKNKKEQSSIMNESQQLGHKKDIEFTKLR